MTAPQTSSRLQLLQARFQQKQLQEKEQKLLQLYDQQQQRAHQVAQRGSAGSNSSNGSSHGSGISNPSKVRQMFEERRQNNPKGIDKSYPLEPLDGRSKKHATSTTSTTSTTAVSKSNHTSISRRNVSSKRAMGADVNSNVNATNRTLAVSQRDNVTRESYASSRGVYKESIAQRENISRECYTSGRGDYNDPNENESVGQLDVHAKAERRYEINIDEVIDNEAMQRNRMLAKFHPLDIEKRRRFSGDIESEESPAEMLHDVPDKVAEKVKSATPPVAPASTRKFTSQAEARTERFKNTNARKSNAAAAATLAPATTKKRSEPTIPTGTNARLSTLMKTTKSASLKVNKLPRNRKNLEDKKKSKPLPKKFNQVKEKPRKQNIAQKLEKSHDEEISCTNWNTLKSTSLIYQIMRNYKQAEQSVTADKIGIVKTIVTKIENTTAEEKVDGKISLKMNCNAEFNLNSLQEAGKEDKLQTPALLTAKKLPSILDLDLYKINKNVRKISNVSRQKNEKVFSKTSEKKDQGDGLICQEEINSLTTRRGRESSVEHPTDYQEITIADQTIKVKKDIERNDEPKNDPGRLSSDCGNRVRRASFELKRMMFEQIQNREKFSRRDSVESALRHFDSIGADVTDSSEPVSIAADQLAKDRKKMQATESTQSGVLNLMNEENRSRALDEQKILSRPENFSSVDSLKASNYSTSRLYAKDSIDKDTELIEHKEKSLKGFEKHTSAWTMKTVKGKAPRRPQTSVKTKGTMLTPASGKKILSRRRVAPIVRKSTNKKLLEARDSIELTRIIVKTKSPACRRKLVFSPKASISTKKSPTNDKLEQIKNNKAAPVRIQSFPRKKIAQQKNTLSIKQSFKQEKCPSSITRNSNAESKRNVSKTKASDSIVKKNVVPYPSSKSPENTPEQQTGRLATKSSSLKFLSQIVGSNGNTEAVNENGSSPTDRDTPDSTTDLRNKSFDEKPTSSITPAPRTASSLSSNSSVGTNRSQGSISTRATKAKLNGANPTPAARASAPSKNTANDDSLTTCKVCNRRFTMERISLHEQICAKTSQKKRKQFDALTHRVRGTELESFIRKPLSKKQSKAAKPEPAPKSNWRRKHEDFINAIRSAKQMQAHLAAGGKLSDLPPPPASDTSDYIQCPHCSRKFNQAAAERHIPKCETMQHNKPNPRAPIRSKR